MDSSRSTGQRPRWTITIPERYHTNNTKYFNEEGWVVNSVFALENERVLPINDLSAKDPNNVEEVKQSEYWDLWLAAIHKELATLKAKDVYEVIDNLSPHRHAVESKWVL